MTTMKEIKASGQLTQMVRFIEQEAKERCEELNAKAEEEFVVEKNNLFSKGRTKIVQEFEKKMKNVQSNKKIVNSKLRKEWKLKVLDAQEKLMKQVFNETVDALGKWTKDSDQYKLVLQKLIVQGLCQLLEKNVRVRCRVEDLRIIESVLKPAAEEFSTILKGKFTAVLSVDQKHYLSPSKHGVILIGGKGRIRCENTLESLLEIIFAKYSAVVRLKLFGPNVHRKHFD